MKDVEVLNCLMTLGSLFSLLGSSFIFFVTWTRDLQKIFFFRIIWFVSLSDLVRSFGNSLGDHDTDNFLCQTQALLSVFGGTASFLWIGLLSGAILIGPRMNSPPNYWKIINWARYVIFTIAAISAILPLTQNSYDNLGGWCFFKLSRETDLWAFGCFYLWLTLVMLLALISCREMQCLCCAKRNRLLVKDEELSNQNHLLMKDDEELSTERSELQSDLSPRRQNISTVEIKQPNIVLNDNEKKIALLKTRWFPFVLLVCWTLPLIYQIVDLFHVSSPFWFKCTRVVSSSLYGFCNSLVFAWVAWVNIKP